MASQKLTNGFTLVELLVVLTIISILSTTTIASQKIKNNKDDLLLFENIYKNKQLKSMARMKPENFNHFFNSNVSQLRFNIHGNINQAQTIQLPNDDFVIQLGAGRYIIK